MKILVSWSIAYDYIMDFEDNFWNYILPEKMHILNLTLFTPTLTKQKWWTWQNIAYNMGLLWEKPILLWNVWNDFNEKSKIIDYSNICKVKGLITASCYIINDKSNNQISAFYPWAMNYEKIQKIPKEDISYAIIAPNKNETMILHLKQSYNFWIKTFFDPGQQISVLSKEELLQSIDFTNYLILNDYEFSLFSKKTGLTEKQILDKIDKIIITLWRDWVKILEKWKETKIDAIKNVNVIDPTWAWDAFRAGLIVWLHRWFDWEKSAKMWCLTANFCIQKYWTQNHKFTKKDFKNKFKENYKENLSL